MTGTSSVWQSRSDGWKLAGDTVPGEGPIIDSSLPDDGKARRAGIFVDWQITNDKAPSGATSSEYAAPTGLKLCLGCGSTKMPRRRRWTEAKRRRTGRTHKRDGLVAPTCRGEALRRQKSDEGGWELFGMDD